MMASLNRSAWARIAPFALFMVLLAVRDVWPEGGLWGLDSRWLYAVQALSVGALLILLSRQFGELVVQNLPTGPEWLVSIAVGIGVFVLWVTLDQPWMTVGEPAASFVPLKPDGRIDLLLVTFRLLGAVVVVPVMEELFWRSFLMRWIDHPIFAGADPQRTSIKAIVLSTFVFTLAHTQWLAAAVAGLAYALLYVKTGKLWTAVAAHALTNALLGAWVLKTQNWAYW